MKRKNPLFYFGWLGLLGVLGLYMNAFVLWPFLAFFFFFSYKNMEPDELFWENVRRAGLKSFVAGASFGLIATIVLFYRSSIAYHLTAPLLAADGLTVSIDAALFEQFILCAAAFVLTFVILICTFAFTLMWYGHKEKKNLEDTSHDENKT